ncbi:MAG TPA: alpha/beta fold hydrolase [Ktedonobacteraceae bacterium]|nr:alpha/beta fold hydrolase [Ktedonobacteraceae bacterium]
MHMPTFLRLANRKTQKETIAVTTRPRYPGHRHRRFIVFLLILSAVLTFGYAAISVFTAMIVESQPTVAETQTPAAFGLQYRDVTFYSRIDHVRLRGWFIPGVLPNGHLTSNRTLIVVHGTGSNRASPLVLGVSSALARKGFAVLAFDMRGMGQSDPAPLSEGYFEQRDVLGAVDFLRSGSLPYPALGHPRIIGAWGDSMGAATVLLAAAHEPAIRAIVSDSGFAAIVPVLQSDRTIPGFFLPGVLQAVNLLYGINYYATRPVDVVASLAPRPLLFIQGSADSVVPPTNLHMLATAAETAPNAHVQVWQVKGADHVDSFHVMGAVYIQRVVTFFTQALGPDTSMAV